METQPRWEPMKVYVGGCCHYDEEIWYCFDLDDLSFSPVAKSKGVTHGGWTVMGEHIYMAGGWKTYEEKSCLHTNEDLLRYNITSGRSWESVGTRKIKARYPRVFVPKGEKEVYMMGEDGEERHCGEVYDIDAGSWKLVAPVVQNETRMTFGFITALIENEKKMLSYSLIFWGPRLLFYDVATGTFHSEDHPKFALGPETLRKDIRFGFLKNTIESVRPAVRDFALFWITQELYLCAYDCSQMQWFSYEKSLYKLLGISESTYCSTWDSFPILVHLREDRFLALIPHRRGETLESALLTITISQGKGKGKGKGKKRSCSLTVSLISHRTLNPEIHFLPTAAMAIWKNIGPSTMNGQSNSAMEN